MRLGNAFLCQISFQYFASLLALLSLKIIFQGNFNSAHSQSLQRKKLHPHDTYNTYPDLRHPFFMKYGIVRCLQIQLSAG